MKLKKKVKILLVLIILVFLIGFLLFVYKKHFKSNTNIVKTVDYIEKYNYKLNDNKTSTYKKMFKELKDILSKEMVNEEDYVKQISKMFIYDFYTLDKKLVKTDVGGREFVNDLVLENFLLNAENTYYKYVENDIYKTREQELPEVFEITIDSIVKEAFSYNGIKDDNAYKVVVKWNYTKDKYKDYQKYATLYWIKNKNKFELVELNKN